MNNTQLKPVTDASPTDEYLRALGGRAREIEASDDGPWPAVARGERSVDEAVASAREQGAEAEALARDQSLFRPLEADERAELLETLERRTGAASPRSWGAAPWLAAAALVALAGASWLWRGTPTDPPPGPAVVAHSALPGYELHAQRGLVERRRDSAEPAASGERLVYRAQTSVQWLLEPGEDVEGPVGVRVFATRGDEVRELDVGALVEISPSGSVRLAGPASALGLSIGDWNVSLLVGRPSALPDRPQVADDAEPPRWRRVDQALRIEASTP